MRDTRAHGDSTPHELDMKLFVQLAHAWQLTDRERAAVLALSSDQYAQWLTGNLDADVAAVAGTRLGHLLAIDLAAHAYYGPGTALAADAVRRVGTAPDGVGAALPLLSGDLASVVDVRRAFEQRAGGAHILTVAPHLLRGRDL